MRARFFANLFSLLFALVALPASASVIFSEDFSGATPGANNSLAGTQFTLTFGAVDIIGVLNGSFAACVNNPGGNCLDLVGSPGLGGISSIPTFNLTAGDTYAITFGYILQGFATGVTPTSDFTVGLGSFSNQLTAIPMVQDASLSFTPGSNETGVNLTFAALTTPDNFHGPVLDHIVLTETSSVTTVPELSTWAMMLMGFAGVGFVGYLRTKGHATLAASNEPWRDRRKAVFLRKPRASPRGGDYRPSISIKFCTAAPEAPLPRLSNLATSAA
jgi:hypothetical protein